MCGWSRTSLWLRTCTESLGSGGGNSAGKARQARHVPPAAVGAEVCLPVERGVLRYPAYSIRRTSPVFPHRQALLECGQALHPGGTS